MQFLADYKDGQYIVECVNCVQTLYSSPTGLSDQDMSDVLNKHAFLSHGSKSYASVHLSPAQTEDRPYLRTASLAFTPAKPPELDEPTAEEVQKALDEDEEDED